MCYREIIDNIFKYYLFSLIILLLYLYLYLYLSLLLFLLLPLVDGILSISCRYPVGILSISGQYLDNIWAASKYPISLTPPTQKAPSDEGAGFLRSKKTGGEII